MDYTISNKDPKNPSVSIAKDGAVQAPLDVFGDVQVDLDPGKIKNQHLNIKGVLQKIGSMDDDAFHEYLKGFSSEQQKAIELLADGQSFDSSKGKSEVPPEQRDMNNKMSFSTTGKSEAPESERSGFVSNEPRHTVADIKNGTEPTSNNFASLDRPTIKDLKDKGFTEGMGTTPSKPVPAFAEWVRNQSGGSEMFDRYLKEHGGK